MGHPLSGELHHLQQPDTLGQPPPTLLYFSVLVNASAYLCYVFPVAAPSIERFLVAVELGVAYRRQYFILERLQSRSASGGDRLCTFGQTHAEQRGLQWEVESARHRGRRVF